ncbi:MAG: transglycosylase SLT domain-containing protein [Bdellovibrio bacteriovorus]
MYSTCRRRLPRLFTGIKAALCLLGAALPLAHALPEAGAGDEAATRFLAAEDALRAGDRATFESLLSGLADYPLYPYLRYADLAADLDGASDQAIESFLEDFPETPQAERLRSPYLERLASEGRWADYARVYRADESAERRCLYLRALLETGRPAQALDPAEIEPLWLVPRSQPAACDPLFAAWEQAGGLTPALVWSRIRLAMEAGESGLARYLGARLPEPERPWLERWLAAYARPERVLEPETLAGDHPLRPAILGQGIARLARSNAAQAADALAAGEGVLAPDQAASDSAHQAVARALIRSGSESDRSRGLAVWGRMSASPDNLGAQEERVRAAARLGDWGRVADWIERMPAGEEKADRWLYWLGRAQAALGLEAEAQASFAHAAQRRSLWGFMAADRLGLPYRLEHRPVPARPDEIRRLSGDAALARIRELRRLGRQADLRREWRTLTRDLDDAGLMAAAYVADLLGWHDQAIFTLARAGYWDDLGLRFPLRYRDLVSEQAWQTGLGEDWIFAVLRQESVFAPDVASSAGALGLMQLMPATARQVAQTLGRPGEGPTRTQILDPELNIALGSTYLAWMRDRFGHAALATAAYNAGPHRVARWLPEDCMEADLWILSIPFAETRGYVERVLAYRVIYGARLGLEPVRVSELLPPVRGRSNE